MSDLISRADIPYHKQLEPMDNGQYVEVEVAYKDDIEALPSFEAEDRTFEAEDRTLEAEDRTLDKHCTVIEEE